MIYDVDFATKVAAALLEIKAVVLRPKQAFQWSSGWLSPIYCDNRLLLSYPDIRNNIAQGFNKILKEKYPDADAIVGVATAGIPMATLLADRTGLPLAYGRPSAKKHGKQNSIEGRVEKGQKVVVVEDLISTGGSSLKVIAALREQGCEVLGLLAIFSYDFDLARQQLQAANVPYHTLSDYNHLLQVAEANSYIQSSDMETLKAWRSSPETFGK